MFLLLLVIGFAMLLTGADFVVRAGSAIALALQVPPLIIGLTIVAFGTSAPELTVSLMAASQASTDMAISNVNGSNLANIAFVLGLAALVAPLMVHRKLLRREIPAALFLQAILPILALDGMFSRIDGLIVIGVGVLYNALLFHAVYSGRETPEEVDASSGPLFTQFAWLVFGLVLLILGSNLFVSGAESIARALHFSDRFIGLTVVALGTSAPEAAAAVAAVRQGEVDLAVGASLGSNILNIAMVLGLTSVVTPIDLSGGGFMLDMSVALFASVMLVPIVLKGSLNRVDGALMFGGYFVYLGYQVAVGGA